MAMSASIPHITCLADLVNIAAKRAPSAIAIEHDHGSLTYAQFWDRSVRIANALLARGLKKGDRVALFAHNCPEYLESYVGLQLAGLVAVPANFRLTPPELSYLIDNSGAKGLFVGAEYLAYLDQLREAGTHVPPVIIVYGDHENAFEVQIGKASAALPARGFGLND